MFIWFQLRLFFNGVNDVLNSVFPLLWLFLHAGESLLPASYVILAVFLFRIAFPLKIVAIFRENEKDCIENRFLPLIFHFVSAAVVTPFLLQPLILRHLSFAFSTFLSMCMFFYLFFYQEFYLCFLSQYILSLTCTNISRILIIKLKLPLHYWSRRCEFFLTLLFWWRHI